MDVAQHNDFAVVFAYFAESVCDGAFQFGEDGSMVGTFSGRREIASGVHHGVERGLASSISFFDVVEACIFNDTVEPGVERHT